MSGEYFSVEDTMCDKENYYEEGQLKNKPIPDDVANFYRDNDVVSNASRKSQDPGLLELEEQLELAETNWNTLKGQFDSMKNVYNKTRKFESPRGQRKPQVSSHPKQTPSQHIDLINGGKKRACSPKLEPHINNHISSKKKQYENHNKVDNVRRGSSHSSAGMEINNFAVGNGDNFHMPVIRQASDCIGTDNSGDAVKTINSILSGITDSFNRTAIQPIGDGRISRRRKSKQRPVNNDAGIVYEIPKKPFSPRVEKRLSQQQKKIEEIVRTKDIPLESDTEKWIPPKASISNINSRSLSAAGWERSANQKNKKTKSKMHSSSDSITSKKPIKSTAKHVENTTKMRPVRTGMVDEDSQMVVLSKKRKRPVKRLKQISKISLGKKHSDNETRKRFEQFTTDNLVELYHNIAAKESDSDESHRCSRSEAERQKGGADLPATPVEIPTVSEPTTKETVNYKEINCKAMNKIEPVISRALSPIEEHKILGRGTMQSDYYANNAIMRNYEQPTISSTLKQATKCYLQSFNFRSIPFCAAKSTSPSHNIGINIQQVMSIIKARRPVTGISPTLAHNITLAAGRLSSHPLKAFVSTLSSRIGYGKQICPLSRSPLNYNQLQEMAKEIPEEPEEEESAEYSQEPEIQITVNAKTIPNGPSGDTQESNPTPVWTGETAPEERCTCMPQKGVPFQQVLKKYQMHPEIPYGNKNATYINKNQCYGDKSVYCGNTTIVYGSKNGRVTRSQKQTRPVFCTSAKQRTPGWPKNDSKGYHETAKKKSDHKELEGKEKNLKMVLTNLHDEFDAMNTKYEDLAKKVSDTDEQSVKTLQEMEAELNKKEEEISMVMSLYTEVMALKDQVKRLRERTSQSSVAVTPTRAKVPEPNAALHLTQLLRQIQNYKEVCKNKKQFA